MKPPDPVVYPPPCSQTITGRFVSPLLLARGVQTLSTRQSSPIGSAGHIGSSAFGTKPKNSESRCGERWPRSKQSFTPVHFSRFAGGINRFAPAVDAAYGTPRNACTPACVCERTLPRFVSTVAPGVGPSAPPSAMASLLFIRAPAANAPMLEPINLRRSMTIPPKVAVHPARRTDAATAARTDPSVPFSLRPRKKFRRAFLALASSSTRWPRSSQRGRMGQRSGRASAVRQPLDRRRDNPTEIAILARAAPQLLRGDSGAFGQRPQLHPRKCRKYGPESGEGAEAAVRSGHDALFAHDFSVANQALRHKLGMLDVIRAG